MQKNSLIITLLVAVVAALAGYQMVIAKPADTDKKDAKVAGEVYVLAKEFLINLADGRFARLDVAMEFEDGYSSAKAAKEYAKAHGDSKHAAEPVEGFGALPQEPVIRDLITDTLTDATARQIQDRDQRERLKRALTRKLNRETDVPVKNVLFTDVAVQ